MTRFSFLPLFFVAACALASTAHASEAAKAASMMRMVTIKVTDAGIGAVADDIARLH